MSPLGAGGCPRPTQVSQQLSEGVPEGARCIWVVKGVVEAGPAYPAPILTAAASFVDKGHVPAGYMRLLAEVAIKSTKKEERVYNAPCRPSSYADESEP